MEEVWRKVIFNDSSKMRKNIFMVNHNTSGTIIQVDCCLTLHRILTTVVCFLDFYENWSHCFEVRFIKMLYMYSISLSYFWYIIVGASALWDFYSDILILSLDQNMLSASHDFVTFLNVEDKVDFFKEYLHKIHNILVSDHH